jgi:putative ABC transport system ATP-binding protein
MTPRASHDPIIACQALSRVYGTGAEAVQALKAATFDIERGDFVAIMGPSGSGKSTLLNLLGALDRPSSGRLVIDGRPTAELSSDALATLRNRDIGFVFQQFHLMRRVTALENVILPLKYSERTGLDKVALAGARLADVGLGDRLHHRPTQLSGGQQQRVAIARALVNDPAILLADEPTGALDSATAGEIMALLRAINAKGKTVILITHAEEVAAYARRILRFRDGAIVSDARPLDGPGDAGSPFPSSALMGAPT